MSEERSFEVVDRRRVRAEGAPVSDLPASEPETAAGHEAGDTTHHSPPEHEHEHEYEHEEGAIPDVRVADILRMSVQLLSDKAWVSIGLVPNPATGKVEQNLAEARRAIDAATDVIKHLEADASPMEKRELQNLLQDLRVNFLRQSTAAGSQ